LSVLFVSFLSIGVFLWFRNNIRLTTTERSLGKVPAGTRHKSLIAASPDGETVACAVERGQSWVVTMNGAEGKAYDEIGEIVFSPNGTKLAYTARRGEKWVVVVDGMEGKEYYGIHQGTLVFSPDGTSVAYMAMPSSSGGFWIQAPDGASKSYIPKSYDTVVVVNGSEGGRHSGIVRDALNRCTLVFSPSGKRVAYVLNGTRGWFVVVDGEGGRPYDAVGQPVFTPRTERVVYPAFRKGKSALVLDGQEQPEWKYHAIKDPVFGSDEKRVAYAARRGKDWFVVVDGNEGKAFNGVDDKTLVFSPDGKRLAYVAWSGKEEGPYAVAGPWGSSEASTLWSDVKWFVVVDGVQGKGYGAIGDLHLGRERGVSGFVSDSGEHDFDHLVMSQERERGQSLFEDGYRPLIDDAAWPSDPMKRGVVLFSPDSERVAYVAQTSGPRQPWQSLVVNGIKGKERGLIPMCSVAFSPDSKSIAYVVVGTEKSALVVDGVVAKEYDYFPKHSQIVFDGPKRFRTIAVRGGEALRVEVQITRK
jgi:hypothetical protein